MTTNEQKQLAKMAVCGVAVVAVFCIAGIKDRKDAAKRQQRAARYAEDLNAYMQNLLTLDEYLDRALETAKFWDIVTRD